MIIVASMLLMYSCTNEVSQEELINGAVAIKLEQWQASQIQTCKTKTLVKAEDYVDSLLVVISLQSKLDTIPKPTKPIKPIKPGFKEKPDSVIVEPIYKKE